MKKTKTPNTITRLLTALGAIGLVSVTTLPATSFADDRGMHEHQDRQQQGGEQGARDHEREQRRAHEPHVRPPSDRYHAGDHGRATPHTRGERRYQTQPNEREHRVHSPERQNPNLQRLTPLQQRILEERHQNTRNERAPRRSEPDQHHQRDRYEWRDHQYRPMRDHGTRVRHLPPGHRSFRYGSERYYFSDGHYYRHDSDGFILVGAPIGAAIASLPFGAISLHIGGIGYYYYDGIYYRPRGPEDYVIVTAPVPPIESSTPQVAVNAAALNLRSGPSRAYSVVNVLYRGDTLYVLDSAGGWYYIQTSSGQVGWVMAAYTTPMGQYPNG